jgi:hypothetical protein
MPPLSSALLDLILKSLSGYQASTTFSTGMRLSILPVQSIDPSHQSSPISFVSSHSIEPADGGLYIGEPLVKELLCFLSVGCLVSESTQQLRGKQ